MEKIQAWRLELGSFSYDVEYRLGKDNVAPDSFTRAFSASMPSNDLEEIHVGLCHPGVTRMLHFIKSKNLPYSTEEVKEVCSACRSCAELKPQFYRQQQPGTLIKATQPMERLSVDLRIHCLLRHVMHIYLLWLMSIPVFHLRFHVRIYNLQQLSPVLTKYLPFVTCPTTFIQILAPRPFLGNLRNI